MWAYVQFCIVFLLLMKLVSGWMLLHYMISNILLPNIKPAFLHLLRGTVVLTTYQMRTKSVTTGSWKQEGLVYYSWKWIRNYDFHSKTWYRDGKMPSGLGDRQCIQHACKATVLCRPYTSARTHMDGACSAMAAGHGNLKVVGIGRGHQLSVFSTFSSN